MYDDHIVELFSSNKWRHHFSWYYSHESSWSCIEHLEILISTRKTSWRFIMKFKLRLDAFGEKHFNIALFSTNLKLLTIERFTVGFGDRPTPVSSRSRENVWEIYNGKFSFKWHPIFINFRKKLSVKRQIITGVSERLFEWCLPFLGYFHALSNQYLKYVSLTPFPKENCFLNYFPVILAFPCSWNQE